MELPSVNLVTGEWPESVVLWGGSRIEVPQFRLVGLPGGQASDADNRIQRDKMIQYLTFMYDGRFMDMYTVDRTSVVGDIWVGNPRSRSVPPASSSEAERYRFFVDFDVSILCV